MSRRPEARRDVLSAAGLAVLAGAYLLANRRYSLDTLATPGPGVFPLAVGVLILGLAAAQAAAAWRSRSEPTQSADVEAKTDRPGRAIAMASVLVAYAAAAGVVGFLTASFAAVLVSSRLLGARDWVRPIALAVGVAVAAHLIFVAWLGVPFPRGLLR
jgi:hypothetical protein